MYAARAHPFLAGEPFYHEGILGTTFVVRLHKEVGLLDTSPCHILPRPVLLWDATSLWAPPRDRLFTCLPYRVQVIVGAGTDDSVRGVIPSVSGQAWVTQHATVFCDPTDPFPEGYTVGDIW